MAGRKRTRYEFTGDEDEWALKCKQCKHSYVTKDQSDEIKCSCRNGQCNYEPVEIVIDNR